METSTRASPYWTRRQPATQHDVAMLLPASLHKNKRFETLADAEEESARSEAVLAGYRPRNQFSVHLRECREGHYECQQTYCPLCARRFRRYFAGELLRLRDEFKGSIKISTVLLEAAPKGRLTALEIARHDALLRKRLARAGLADVAVIGGFEMVYRARTKKWVLHVNLMLLGGRPKALAAFRSAFSNPDLDRPVDTVSFKDPAKQLPYVLKFTTYHRPLAQTGPTKSPAKPLNSDLHYELVSWMAQHKFTDHIFLFNARRSGPTINLSNKVLRKA